MQTTGNVRLSPTIWRPLLVLALILGGCALSRAAGVDASGCTDHRNGDLALIAIVVSPTDPFDVVAQACVGRLTITEGDRLAWDLKPRARVSVGFADNAQQRWFKKGAAEFAQYTVTANDVDHDGDGTGDKNGLDILRGMTATIGNGSDERLGSSQRRNELNGGLASQGFRAQRYLWVPNGSISRDVEIVLTFQLTQGVMLHDGTGNHRQIGNANQDKIKLTITVENSDASAANDVIVNDTTQDAVEGKALRYAVMLNDPPTGANTVTVTPSASTASLVTATDSFQPASLTFNAKNAHLPQFITANLAEDGNTTPDTLTISHTATGTASISADAITVTVADVQDANVAIVHMTTTPPPAAGLVLHEAGAGDTLTISLSPAVNAEVVVDIAVDGWNPNVPTAVNDLLYSNNNARRLRLDTYQLTFPAGSTAGQTVTLRPVGEYSEENCADDSFKLSFSSPTHTLIGADDIDVTVVDAERFNVGTDVLPGLATTLGNMTIEQQHCVSDLLQFSAVGDKDAYPTWWRESRFISISRNQDYAFDVWLLRDPGSMANVTIELGVRPVNGGEAQNFPTGVQGKLAEGTFANQKQTLLFTGGMGGNWNTPQKVTLRVDNTYIGTVPIAVQFELENYPGIVPNASTFMLIRVPPAP